jgi:uncharacterized protein (TIGR02594 family)
MTSTLEIQRALRALGYDPGPIDGIRGRLTIGAVKAFQADHGLVVDGIVGPRTAAKLFRRRAAAPPRGGSASLPPPQGAEVAQLIPWYAEARRLVGTREAPGKANNPVIMDWADNLDIHYPGDDVPWCGLFVAHCIASALPDEPLPDNPLGARQWLKLGLEHEPSEGAVLVFWRGSKGGWLGHVGFYAGEDAGAFHVLGGNQSNAVTVARIARSRLLGARWPRTAPQLPTRRIEAAATGALSKNEA